MPPGKIVLDFDDLVDFIMFTYNVIQLHKVPNYLLIV